MRVRTTVSVVVILGTLLLGTAVFAQEGAEPLAGTVYLRGGQVLSGVIRIAELGVVQGSGIGTLLGDGGAFTVRVDGDDYTVRAANLAMLEADWANEGTEENPTWKIQEITLTTKGGEVVSGKPTWLIHATEVSIEGQPPVHAFPLAGTNFSPDNFIAKIVMSGFTVVEAPPAEAPPLVTPPVETPPGELEVSLPPPLVGEFTGVVLGEGELMSFTITCPECGKKIRVTINAQAVAAE